MRVDLIRAPEVFFCLFKVPKMALDRPQHEEGVEIRHGASDSTADVGGAGQIPSLCQPLGLLHQLIGIVENVSHRRQNSANAHAKTIRFERIFATPNQSSIYRGAWFRAGLAAWPSAASAQLMLAAPPSGALRHGWC